MTESGAGGRPLAYTPEEAAELLRVSPSLIRSLVRSGVLPRVAGLGRAMRIPSRALFEFVGEPVPDLPAALAVSPSEVSEPRLVAPVRPPPTSRVVIPTSRPPVRRPTVRRPRPPEPEGPIRAGEQRLWLLADSSQYRLISWHIGIDQATCGRRAEGRWRRSADRSPYATMCPACLTAVVRLPGVDIGSIPIRTVCMVRETRRGESVTLIKSGWHLGNGRVTKCGKREGPWYLTERSPRKDICFVCGERRRWEQEKIKGSLEAESAGKPRFTVLLDEGLVAPDLETLVRRVPSYFAVRRAVRPVTADDFAHYGRGLHELFGASAVLSGSQTYSWNMAPDVTVTDDPDVAAVGQVHWGVMEAVAFLDWARPQVERAEKVQALRSRWDRDAATRRVGARHQRAPHAASGGLETWHDEPSLRPPAVDELLGREARSGS